MPISDRLSPAWPGRPAIVLCVVYGTAIDEPHWIADRFTQAGWPRRRLGLVPREVPA